jgi:D-lactate dehydrogenase
VECVFDQLDSRPTILFVEAEPWERERLVALCPGHCRVVSRAETLQDLADGDLPPDVTVLSPFVHSTVNAAQLARLPELRLVSTRSTGYDHVDLAACGERGIVVCNVPEYGENTVAEHTFAMLLALTRKIHRCYERTVRGDFSSDGLRGVDLYGKTLGVVGAGKIARRVLAIAGGFGMRRLACDVREEPELAARIGFEYVPLDELLARSDVVSLHVPHTPQTHHLIDAAALARMKPTAILVNTARGGVVDSQALIDALRGGRIAGAALDVLEGEHTIGEEAEIVSSAYDAEALKQIVRNTALLRMDNVIVTPHNAFNSEEALGRIVETTLENIHAHLLGRATHVVNPEARGRLS